jgi:hypothetical protein
MYYEYHYRYEKEHKAGEILLHNTKYPENLKDIGLTKFAQCVPDKYKSSDVVQTYRDYFNAEKRHLFSWKKRPIPEWIK